MSPKTGVLNSAQLRFVRCLVTLLILCTFASFALFLTLSSRTALPKSPAKSRFLTHSIKHAVTVVRSPNQQELTQEELEPFSVKLKPEVKEAKLEEPRKMQLKSAPSKKGKTLKPVRERPLIIAMGASSNHFTGLLTTIYHVKRYEPQSRLIVWDLGLDNWQRKELNSLRRVDVKTFPWKDFPDWMNVKNDRRGEYAWKPLAILMTSLMKLTSSNNKAIHQRVMWLDSDIVLKCPLDEVYDELDKQGVYSLASQADLKKWVHPGLLQFMNLTFAGSSNNTGHGNTVDPHAKMGSGGVVAFDRMHQDARGLMHKWQSCAHHLECISPPGSSRENHRQDQSILSVLMHQYHKEIHPRGKTCIYPHAHTGMSRLQLLREIRRMA